MGGGRGLHDSIGSKYHSEERRERRGKGHFGGCSWGWGAQRGNPRSHCCRAPARTSWLPNDTCVIGSAFRQRTIARPLSILLRIDGERKSPARMVQKRTPDASVSLISVRSRGKLDSSYTSLTEISRSVRRDMTSFVLRNGGSAVITYAGMKDLRESEF